MTGFMRSENGATTIPTIFWLPVFIMILFGSVELMVINMRQVLLERAVDVTTRALRIGTASLPSHQTLKTQICSRVIFASDCMQNLAVEVFPVDRATWSMSNPNGPLCTDSTSSEVTDPVIQTGTGDQLVVLRACLKYKPMTNLDPIALALPKDGSGRASIIAMTVFVNEPK